MTEANNWAATIGRFLESDVIRWTENVWPEKKKGRGGKSKPKLLGKQHVIGQILLIDGEFVSIKIMEAVVLEQAGRDALRIYKTDDIIRKKITTIEKGEPNRLLWQDEETRAEIIASKKYK